MVGRHTVTLIPDPDVAAWGPVLNSNAYLTTDLVGWVEAPFTGPWTWTTGGYATGPVATGWINRDASAPIPRGASTMFRLRIRFTVAAAGQVAGGMFFGDTPLAAQQGPFWAGGSHAALAETLMNCPTAGSYLFEFTFDPSSVPAAFTYVGPQIHYGNNLAMVIDSIELQGQGSEAIDVSCLVDQVQVRHGRDDADSQPEAGACTIDLSLDTGEEALPDALDVGGIIRVTTTTAEASSTRFVGRITDINLGWEEAGDDTPNRVVAQVIATSLLSELGRRVVGDSPWPQQLDGARVAAILSAAGFDLDPTTSDPGTVQILARDVDSQPALDVAQGTAISAGGIVWDTRAGDVRYADADHRRGATPSLELDACDILVTPTWRRTSEGLINKVSIGYGVPPEGQDQPRYVAQRDDSIDAYGRYEFTSTTELAAQADAAAMGQLLLTRNRVPVWIMSDLPVATDELTDAAYTSLLSIEMHDLISLTGLPAAGDVPTSAFLWVEGWTETLAWGVHDMTLVVSGYCRTSPPPRWNDVGSEATWDSQGDLTWDDSTCLGPLPSSGRWDDVPASNRWDQNPFTVTWDTWKG